jgi:hypothetical protein
MVDIAPTPALTGFGRAHDRMTALVKVLGGMLMRARVTATDVTAREAHPQMRPVGLAVLLAFLALPGGQRLRLVDRRVEMFAGARRRFLLPPA